MDEPCFGTELDRGGCAAYFVAYHKTGNRLLETFVPSVSAHLLRHPVRVVKWNKGVFGHRRFRDSTPVARVAADFELAYQHIPEAYFMLQNLVVDEFKSAFEWPQPPLLVSVGEGIVLRGWKPWAGKQPMPGRFRGRVVHLVRRPADLVASAFRYHTKADHLDNEFMESFHALRCGACDPDAWRLLFRRCGYDCTYVDLLAEASEHSLERGLHMEYVCSSASLRLMMENLLAWANHSAVLHVRTEDFVRRPRQLVSCVARFLVGSRTDAGDWHADQDTIDRMLAEVNRSHTTSDVHTSYQDPRWAGVDLRGALLAHPAWGPGLRAAEALLATIWRRQARAYGCPEPPRLS